MDEEPTIDQMVKKYKQIHKLIEDIENETKEKVKPYKEALSVLENVLAAKMHEWGVNSLPTDYGTAYKTTVQGVKITNRQEFLEYAIRENTDLLQISCNKTALKAYKEKKIPYPPGIEVSEIFKVNVRGK